MSMFFSRSTILPAWLVVFGALALLASPMTLATGTLLFFAGVVPPAIMFILWKEPPPTVAEVLHRVDTSRTT
jgi:hypothetical protein